MDLNSIEELNKLESKIRETQSFLKKSNADKQQIKRLKSHKMMLILLALLLFTASLFLYYYTKNPTINTKFTNDLLLSKDSITSYRDSVRVLKEIKLASKNNIKKNDTSQKIIYNVQLRTFKYFNVTTNSLKGISKNGINKFSLGDCTKYKDIKTLKDYLKKIGFKDCFIVAYSYGKKTSIKEALILSNEAELLIK
ncbi:MAG: hypothetical protein L3J23_04730 [Flavobacteriaceae bacterium]|nr:hypothetical protein [Flavobacteriaceae bacterium]